MKNYSLSGTLHTDVLEEIYGNTTVHVMQDDDTIREVLLLDEQQIVRTYAITMKHNAWKENKGIYAVNETIKKGEAIGKAFKIAGYSIQKNVLDVFLIRIPSWLQLAFDTEQRRAKARISEFIVKKEDAIFNYAIITEIYAPDFRKPEINERDEMQINIPTVALLKMGFSNEEIWVSLQQGIIAPHLAKNYSETAKEVKKKVHSIMMEALPLMSFY